MDEDLNEFGELKRKVDLAHVGRLLGIDFQQQRDGKWQARCPWEHRHNEGVDRNPSLHVFTGDDGFQRWKCSPCNAHGDVYDLIQRRKESVTGVTDAYDWLLDHKEEVPEPPESQPPEDKDFTEELAKHEGDVLLALEKFYADRPERDEVDFAWIAEEFRLRAYASSNGLLIPQYAEDGETLPAVRTRHEKKNWSPQGMVDSRHNNLYGIWRYDPDVHDKILLVEGESDTWAASYWLRGRRDWCVLGLPSGATQTPRAEWVDLLKINEVTIALDADKTGRRAAKGWVGMLAPKDMAEISRGFPLRVATMPEGSDICEVGREWVQRVGDHVGPRLVTDYQHKSAVIQPTGSFYTFYNDKGEASKITDFTLDVVEVLRSTDIHGEPEITLKVRSSLDGHIYVLRSSDLAGKAPASKWAGRIGGDFKGGAAQAGALWAYLMTCHAPFEANYYATGTLGWNGASFVLPDDVIGEQTYRYLPPEDSVGGLEDLTTSARASATFEEDVLLRLAHTQTYDVSTVVMGWYAAAFARPLVSIGFPVLHVRGRAGTGKTAMMEAMGRVFGFQITQDLAGAATSHTIKALISATNAIPVVLDEYHASIPSHVEDRLHQMWRSAWKSKTMRSGGSEASPRSVDASRASAPLAVIGEHDVSEQSLIQRSVQVIVNSPQWGGTSTRGSVNPESIRPDQCWGLGRWWLRVVLDMIQQGDSVHFGPVPEVWENRADQGLAVVRWGYEALASAARSQLGVILPQFDGSMVEGRMEERASDPLLDAVSHILNNKSGDPRDNSSVRRNTQGGQLMTNHVYITVYDFIAQCRRKGIPLPAPDKNAIEKDLRSLGFRVREENDPDMGQTLVLVDALDDPRLRVANEG